jgi:hypothetical protein
MSALAGAVVALVVSPMVVLPRFGAFRRGWRNRRTWDEERVPCQPIPPITVEGPSCRHNRGQAEVGSVAGITAIGAHHPLIASFAAVLL